MEPISRTGEFGLIRWIRGQTGQRPFPWVHAGIGDDAAVLLSSGPYLLATTDAAVEGVHFDLGLETPYQVGYRAVIANVSDIHAMGGRAKSLLAALGAPPSTDRSVIEGLYEGMADAARPQGVAIVGGDTVSSPSGIVLSLTVLGETDLPVFRSGARKGDGLYLAGSVGESALGLELLRVLGRPVALERGEQPVLGRHEGGALARTIRKHVLPEVPPVPPLATSMIDVSDGLLGDARHLAEESGMGLRIEEELVPLGEDLLSLAPVVGKKAIELALHGGEDYALLFTLGADQAVPEGAARIGTVTSGESSVIGVDGLERPFGESGWDHFRRGQSFGDPP